jgi:hypothetical protein
MPRELFLVPMEGSGTRIDPVRGKYVRDAQVTAAGCLRYSRADHAIVMIDATQSYLDSVAAQPDTTRLATEINLESVLTAGQANNVKTVFENLFIPDLFANAGDTRRKVIRGVIGMFLFSQRMEGRLGSGWKEKAQSRGVTLDSTWTSFPQVLKDEFVGVRDSFGWSNLPVTGASTLREILKAISDQFTQTEFFIGGLKI